MWFVSILTANAQLYQLNDTYNGTTNTTCTGIFTDNSNTGNYAANQDRHITFCPINVASRVVMEFTEFNIHPTDTFFLYNGPDLNSLPFYSANEVPYYQNTDLNGVSMYATSDNPSGCITARFVSDGTQQAAGWRANIRCENKCQDVISALDTFYMRYNENTGWTTRELKIERDITLKKLLTTDHTTLSSMEIITSGIQLISMHWTFVTEIHWLQSLNQNFHTTTSVITKV